MKNRPVFIGKLAAAMVLIAAIAGALVFYQNQPASNQQNKIPDEYKDDVSVKSGKQAAKTLRGFSEVIRQKAKERANEK